MAAYENNVNLNNVQRIRPDEDTADLRVVIYNIVKNWWVILIGAFIAALISYVVISETYTPQYYTESTLVVSSKDGGSDQVYSNLVIASRLAESFKYVMRSPALKQKIADSLGMKKFDGTITAKSIENTNLIQIGVKASSPKIAFDEMTGIIKYHGLVSENILGDAVLDVLKAPTIPITPVNTAQRLKYGIITAAATAVVIAAVIAAMTLLGDDVMTERDLDKRVDCPNLATISHERKNLSLKARLHGEKQSMLIVNPTTSFKFAETYRLFRTRLEYIMKQKKYKVLMVSSVFENEGKTTTAANIALTLAMNNKKTLLIDGDMLKPALYKVLDAKVQRGTAVNEAIARSFSPDDLPSYDGAPALKLMLGKTSVPDSAEVIGSAEMKSFIDRARECFDYIVIDTPPVALAGDAECFAELSDCAILVIKQGCARAAKINDSIDSLTASGADVLGCIFNNVRSVDLFGISRSGSGYESNYSNRQYGAGYGDSRRGYGGYGGGYGSYGNYGSYGGYGSYGSRRENRQANGTNEGKDLDAGSDKN
ncbi:MAG: polysaccharide biosynthesis tyrosine autokinase [Clostridiales bacterium]|nr:polysaccharide biosynthesis tyrosine autokinase [Clostridiales bacterium]